MFVQQPAYDSPSSIGYINRVNGFGETRLHECCMRETRQSFIQAKLLIQHGADVNIADLDGQTPLMTAARNGCVNILKLLLENGANAELQNKFGESALHFAAETGKMAAIEVLLKFHAPIDAINDRGQTSAYIARLCGNEDIAKTISKSTNIGLKKHASAQFEFAI